MSYWRRNASPMCSLILWLCIVLKILKSFVLPGGVKLKSKKKNYSSISTFSFFSFLFLFSFFKQKASLKWLNFCMWGCYKDFQCNVTSPTFYQLYTVSLVLRLASASHTIPTCYSAKIPGFELQSPGELCTDPPFHSTLHSGQTSATPVSPYLKVPSWSHFSLFFSLLD